VLFCPRRLRAVWRLGVVSVREDDRAPAPSRNVLLDAWAPTAPDGSETERAAGAVKPVLVSGKPGVSRTVAAPAEPSWGRVLATTVKLWVLWRLRSVGVGPPRKARQQRRTWFRRRPRQPRRPTARRWRLAAFVLAVALVAVAVLRFAGVFTGTSAPAAPARSPEASPAGRAGAHGTPSLDAAAWIAGQVSGNAMIACYPDMCAALQAQGVMAGRLIPLRPGAAGPPGASVMVTSPSVRRQLAEQYAPALIASFGSGDTRIDVRATEPGGAAAYESAQRADLAARKAAGSQLLRNWRLKFTSRDAAQLRAGEVDTRLLATLAALASQYMFRVPAFGDASPGAPLLFREVTITSGGGNGAADLAAALAIVRAQAAPYLPAHATIVHPSIGQNALSIEFAAPSPLGLLTAVLVVDHSA